MQSGMQPARPSKRDGLLPQHITDTLCQAHDCAPVTQAISEDELAPQVAGAVWHGLALDLLLGNLQQPLWGWADARSIYWLDYWASLDPHLTFVMVYDHPASTLQACGVDLLSGQHGTPPDMAVSRLLENWQAYNGAMLQFYSRQTERCLLVNARRAREQLAEYLQELGTQLHHRAHLVLGQPLSPAEPQYSFMGSHILSLAITQGGGPQHLLTDWFGTDNVFEQQLLEQLLQHHPMALQIFQELEAAATVRGAQPTSAPAMHPGQAWIQLIDQRQAMVSLTLSLYEQLIEQQQRTLSTQNQLALGNSRTQAIQTQLQEAQTRLECAEEEAELLLAQLHQVQEGLEEVVQAKAQAHKQRDELARAKVAETAAKQAEAQGRAAEQQAKEQALAKVLTLTVDVTKLVEAKDQTLAQLQQLHQDKAQVQQRCVELAKAKDAETAAKQAEAQGRAAEQQAKEQALAKAQFLETENATLAEAKAQAIAEVQQLEKDKTQAQQRYDELAKAAKAPVQLLPAALEPTKVQELEVENDLLLAQLHQVQVELERYYLENQDLKQNLAKPKTKPHGAAQRLQQQLSYRLGTAMISNSHSLGGWLRMPFALSAQVRAYKADRSIQEGQKLSPIHSYADANEAERLQQHLSYKLGQTMLKHGKTPWGWVLLPFAIAGTVRRFRKARS